MTTPSFLYVQKEKPAVQPNMPGWFWYEIIHERENKPDLPYTSRFHRADVRLSTVDLTKNLFDLEGLDSKCSRNFFRSICSLSKIHVVAVKRNTIVQELVYLNLTLKKCSRNPNNKITKKDKDTYCIDFLFYTKEVLYMKQDDKRSSIGSLKKEYPGDVGLPIGHGFNIAEV